MLTTIVCATILASERIPADPNGLGWDAFRITVAKDWFFDKSASDMDARFRHVSGLSFGINAVKVNREPFYRSPSDISGGKKRKEFVQDGWSVVEVANIGQPWPHRAPQLYVKYRFAGTAYVGLQCMARDIPLARAAEMGAMSRSVQLEGFTAPKVASGTRPVIAPGKRVAVAADTVNRRWDAFSFQLPSRWTLQRPRQNAPYLQLSYGSSETSLKLNAVKTSRAPFAKTPKDVRGLNLKTRQVKGKWVIYEMSDLEANRPYCQLHGFLGASYVVAILDGEDAARQRADVLKMIESITFK